MARDPYQYFRVEAAEILEQLEKGVLQLEEGAPPSGVVPGLLRLAHTLKGAARVVKHARIAELCHGIEDALSPHRASSGSIERAEARALLEQLDAMRGEIAALAQPPAAGAGAEAPRSAERAPEADVLRTVRADLDEMNALVDGLSEVEVRLEALKSSRRGHEHAKRVAARLDPAVHELNDALAEIETSSEVALDRVYRELREVREAAERLRLVPAETLFASLERLARDAAEATHKSVKFAAHGGDVRLDAHVLSTIQPALAQLVRNAVAHGIEAEAARRASGKPALGAVEITVARRGRRAFFSCRDDGAGIDLDAVRRIVGERRPPSSDGDGPRTEEQLLAVLLEGGLSTSPTLTQMAGRGVGLDVARDAVRRLGGEVRARTEPGLGTTFEIAVPISLASLDALLVEAGPVRAAIPIDAVRRTLRVSSLDVARSPEGTTLMDEGRAITFADLGSLLGHASELERRSSGSGTAVVVEAGGIRVALGVDRLLGTGRVVMRALSPLAHAEAIVAAGSLDAGGDPRLVLDPDALVAAARRAPVMPERAAPLPPPLLVIDDSLTTRMLEQSILEVAGYDVDVASSAEQGLEKARLRRYGCFLVDVEMPGMDGFAFVRETRGDPTLQRTPAILVTSRDAPEDRKRGIDAGASAYVVKGEFDQSELLRTIRRLVEGA
jgi:two-component system chemotaxis sensor kinase CheA